MCVRVCAFPSFSRVKVNWVICINEFGLWMSCDCLNWLDVFFFFFCPSKSFAEAPSAPSFRLFVIRNADIFSCGYYLHFCFVLFVFCVKAVRLWPWLFWSVLQFKQFSPKRMRNESEICKSHIRFEKSCIGSLMSHQCNLLSGEMKTKEATALHCPRIWLLPLLTNLLIKL